MPTSDGAHFRAWNAFHGYLIALFFITRIATVATIRYAIVYLDGSNNPTGASRFSAGQVIIAELSDFKKERVHG